MRRFIEAHPNGLTEARLPAYAPNLNPVEGAWANIKGGLGNLAATDADQLTAIVKNPPRPCTAPHLRIIPAAAGEPCATPHPAPAPGHQPRIRSKTPTTTVSHWSDTRLHSRSPAIHRRIDGSRRTLAIQSL